MAVKVLFVFVLCTFAAILAREVSKEEWEKYKQKFNKFYGEMEDEARIDAYGNSLDVIEGYNKLFEKGKVSFTCQENQNADLTVGDFGLVAHSLQNLTENDRPPAFRIFNASLETCMERCIPKNWDWVKEYPAMDVIVEQGELCGSCYTFATAAVIEAHNFIHNGGNYIKLSEQQILDCSAPFGNRYCEYGAITAAHNYFISDTNLNKGTARAPRGAMKADDYEYIAESNEGCFYDKKKAKVFVKQYMGIPPNENALMIALAKYGPVAVGIDASLSSFHFYSSGIYDDPKCRSDTNTHALVVVGYGSENGTDYWVIKNSWGRGWGMKGYGRVLRNGKNFCGILNMPVFPIIDKTKTNKGVTTKHIIPKSLKNCVCASVHYKY